MLVLFSARASLLSYIAGRPIPHMWIKSFVRVFLFACINTNNISNTTTYNLSNGSQSGNNQMSNQSQSDMLNRSIRFNIDSTPRGARVFWRVISSITNEVSGSNEMWLGNTPIEVNRTFNIPGLTYENSRHIQIEIKVRQNGYIDQTRTFNLRQAIDMQDISAYYDLVPAQ